MVSIKHDNINISTLYRQISQQLAVSSASDTNNQIKQPFSVDRRKRVIFNNLLKHIQKQAE